ncbi:oxidoreductase [Roseicyclus marinus]|uniref:oxidoreductase n=1 Tax=Roseicyclus marinus TaxID=2161673 RepID=UPI00240F2520|nr:oxidoreductase [Roseicyclus marinus]MDG3042520.1 oxidoreductase [Roseicyclus marinus]
MGFYSLAKPLTLAAAILAAGTATALEPTEGEVLLTVTGEIGATNSGQAAEFDLPLLETLGTVVIETSTIWTDGLQTFEGVELVDLLDAIMAEGSSLRAIAHNDYAVDIPIADAIEGGPIIAFLRNGELMGLRDKGPLWLIYPFDSSPEYQSETIYSRSIWQLDRIEVLP